MEQTDFKVTFTGSAVEDGQIDVNDLVPSLLAISDLIQVCNRTLNQDRMHIAIKVKATQHGSFEVLLQVEQLSILENIKHILDFAKNNKDDISCVKELLELIFMAAPLATGCCYGLYKLIKSLKSEKPSALISHDNGMTEIHIGDTIIKTPSKVVYLAQNTDVREALEKSVSILSKNGIDSLCFNINNKQSEEKLIIEKQDKEFFNAPTHEETLLDQASKKMTLQIISLSFKHDNKWRLTDGGDPFTATIEDQDFLNKIENNQISFSKNDYLVCQVEEKQFLTSKGLKKERRITHVLEHRPSARQLKLL